MSYINPVGTVAVTQAQIAAGNVVVRPNAGTLYTVLVTTTTTVAQAITFVDSTTGAGGTVIGIIPGGTAAGTIFSLNMPAILGIAIQQNAGLAAGAITVSVG